MDMCDLTADERMALVGLAGFLIAADGRVSTEELEELKAIGSEMGSGAFHEAAQASSRRFSTPDELLDFAATLTRPDARELMHTVLVDLAVSDAVDDSERVFIRKLADAWGIDSRL